MEHNISDILKGRRLFVLYDPAVEAYAHGLRLAVAAAGQSSEKASAPASVSGSGHEPVVYMPVHGGEPCKNMDTVLELCRNLLEHGADRDSLLLAVGGGVVCDLVGFAAGIFMRGIGYANVPTTLLAMVDASTGGKCGVNLDGRKNMLGLFKMPEFTLLDTSALMTLPKRELLCGAAELLKTFIIRDEGGCYDKAVSLFSDMDTTAREEMVERLEPLVKEALAVKESIVAQDPFDRGARHLLNFGHTFAHAIEFCAARHGDDIKHGEAVAMGMILAAGLSERLDASMFPASSDGFGSCPAADSGAGRSAAELVRDFSGCGLPVECPYSFAELAEAMSSDKKASGDGVDFVLLDASGNVFVKNLEVGEAVRLLTGK